jgi:hypothetical protein
MPPMRRACFRRLLRSPAGATQESVGGRGPRDRSGMRPLLPGPQPEGNRLPGRHRRLPDIRPGSRRERDRTIARRAPRTRPVRPLDVQHRGRVPDRQARNPRAELSPLAGLPLPSGGRLAASPVGRRRRCAAAALLGSVQRSLHASRDRAQSPLDALAGRGCACSLRQLVDLALQFTVLADQLGDHRVELTDEITRARAPASSRRRSVLAAGRTSAPARCILLCFLWCHFHSCQEINRVRCKY